MDFISLLLLAAGLSMDAFAVAICKGLALKKITLRHALIVGLWFGGFQALMPLIGYFLAAQFKDAIAAYDHWIAFGLLSLIGGNMIREALFEKDEPETDDALSVRSVDVRALPAEYGDYEPDLSITPGGVPYVFIRDLGGSFRKPSLLISFDAWPKTQDPGLALK